MAAFIAAMVVFVAGHVVLSSLPIRARLIAALGESGFRAGYSMIAIAMLAWVIIAYNVAPVVELWSPPTDLRHLSLLLMLIACVFLVAGLTTANPTRSAPTPRRTSPAGRSGSSG